MAQKDAMEQVKEVVRQLIKYRFWIAVSAAALFGLIAYFVGAGPVREEAKKETANIKKAETEVKTVYVALNPHQGVQAHRRGEDRDPDQGCQHRLEDRSTIGRHHC